MYVLWLKAFHVVFVVTWFAGLFYLPRLFIYHASATDIVGRERFVVMERRLFAIMTIGMALAVVLGMAMIALQPGYASLGWLHVKLLLVVLLVGYHFFCRSLMRELEKGERVRSQRWYRLFNEVPGVFLIAIVVLAIVKPAL